MSFASAAPPPAPVAPPSVCDLVPPSDVQARIVCATAIRDSTVTPNRVYGVTRAVAATLAPVLAAVPTRFETVVQTAARDAGDRLGVLIAAAIGSTVLLSVGAVMVTLACVSRPTRDIEAYGAAASEQKVVGGKHVAIALGVALLGVLVLLAVLGVCFRRRVGAVATTLVAQTRAATAQTHADLQAALPAVVTAAGFAYLEYGPPAPPPPSF